MKGQLSLEYLLVSVVALAMLSISAAALLEVKDFSERRMDDFRSRSSAIALADAVEEVCALGNGNQRTVVLHSRISADWNGELAIGNMSRDVACEVLPADDLEGAVLVKNNNGMIKIREQ